MRRCYIVNCKARDFVPHPECRGVYIKPVVDEQISPGIKVVLVKVVPGAEIKPHIHDTVEVFYIIKGQGQASANGELQNVGTGCCIYAPAGQIHGLYNSSEEELILLANFPQVKE